MIHVCTFFSGFLPTIEAVVLRKPSDIVTYWSRGHRWRVVGVQSYSEVHDSYILEFGTPFSKESTCDMFVYSLSKFLHPISCFKQIVTTWIWIWFTIEVDNWHLKAKENTKETFIFHTTLTKTRLCKWN